MCEIDIFVSPTGIITLDHLKKLKYNTHVGNTGHFDNEVDLACSEGLDGTESTTSSLRRSLLSPPLVTGPLALQMWRFKGFFALFPNFKKVRSPTASAEMTRQVEISTLSAHQMALAGVVAHTNSWTPAAYEPEESAPWNSDVGGLPVLPVGRREQGDKVECILMGLTAGNAAGYRGGAINTGIEDFLVLPAVPVVPLLPGPALRDGFSMFWFFGSLFQRRCGAPLASCCGSGNVHLFRRCGVSSASCCGSGNLSSFISLTRRSSEGCSTKVQSTQYGGPGYYISYSNKRAIKVICGVWVSC